MPAGADTDFALATAKATSLNALSHALGAADMLATVGISQSSPPASIRRTCNARLAAVRKRAAIIGWSLRKKLPITKARSNSLNLTIGIPSHGADAAPLISV